MIKIEKVGNELVMIIKCNHEIVDDCFLFASMNAPSEGKQLIMEETGKAYENYVKSLASESDMKYLNDEFSKIIIENIPQITMTPNELENIFQDQQVKINEYQFNTKKQACLIKLLLTLEETYQNIVNANSK